MLVAARRTGPGIPRFMRRYLESYEHALLVQTFSIDSNLISFALPFIGAVSFGTVSTLLSCIATLYAPAPHIVVDFWFQMLLKHRYGIVYSATGARNGLQCNGLL